MHTGALARDFRARPLLVLPALCVVAVAATLVALALGHTPQVDKADLSGAAANFALLRSPAGPALPAAFAAAVTHAAAHEPSSYQLQPAAAHEAATGTWLIPGTTGLCLATRDSEGIGVRCAGWQAAQSGAVSFTVREQASGREQIVGVAPDGVRQVRAVDPSGRTLALALVRDNLYVLSARNVARLDVE
jgi:hypothetical protein